MAAGHFARHLSRMRSLYTERRKALATALAAAMPQQLEINLEDGGMHFVARLRGRTSAAEMVAAIASPGDRAVAAVAVLVPGSRNERPDDRLHQRGQGGCAAAADRMMAAMR